MQPVGDEALKVDIRSKSFRSPAGSVTPALKDLRFVLRRGDILAVLGPSGAGKTTLLRILAGLDKDFAGKVEIAAGAKVGVVFQEPRLLPWRNVEANIRIVAPALDAQVFERIVANLALSEHLSHFPRQLSLGLARRAALARALAIEPDVLILDEPFASLDRPLARRLRADLARTFAHNFTTVVFSTHAEDDVADLATRALTIGGPMEDEPIR